MPGILDLPPELIEQIYENFADYNIFDKRFQLRVRPSSDNTKFEGKSFRLTSQYIERTTRHSFINTHFAAWVLYASNDACIAAFCAAMSTPGLAERVKEISMCVEEDRMMNIQGDLPPAPVIACKDSARGFDSAFGGRVPAVCLRNKERLIKALAACRNLESIIFFNTAFDYRRRAALGIAGHQTQWSVELEKQEATQLSALPDWAFLQVDITSSFFYVLHMLEAAGIFPSEILILKQPIYHTRVLVGLRKCDALERLTNAFSRVRSLQVNFLDDRCYYPAVGNEIGIRNGRQLRASFENAAWLTNLRLSFGLGAASVAAWKKLARGPALPNLRTLQLEPVCDLRLEDYTSFILKHMRTLRRMCTGVLHLRKATTHAFADFYEILSNNCEIVDFRQGYVDIGRGSASLFPASMFSLCITDLDGDEDGWVAIEYAECGILYVLQLYGKPLRLALGPSSKYPTSLQASSIITFLTIQTIRIVNTYAMLGLLVLPPELIERCQVGLLPDDQSFRLTNCYIQQATRHSFAATYFAVQSIKATYTSIDNFCAITDAPGLAKGLKNLTVYAKESSVAIFPRIGARSSVSYNDTDLAFDDAFGAHVPMVYFRNKERLIKALAACENLKNMVFCNRPVELLRKAVNERRTMERQESENEAAQQMMIHDPQWNDFKVDITSSVFYFFHLLEVAGIFPQHTAIVSEPGYEGPLDVGLENCEAIEKGKNALKRTTSLSLKFLSDESFAPAAVAHFRGLRNGRRLAAALTRMPALTDLNMQFDTRDRSSAAWSILARAPDLPCLTTLDLTDTCIIDLADFQSLILNHIDTLRKLKIDCFTLLNGTSDGLGRCYEKLLARCKLDFFCLGLLRFGLRGRRFRFPASLGTPFCAEAENEDGFIKVINSDSMVWEGREDVKTGLGEMARALRSP